MPRTNLTQVFIDSADCACPPGRKSYEYNDRQIIGLYCGVTPAGCKTYRFAYKDDSGKRRHIALGRASDISLKDARTAAQKMRSRLASGDDPAEERQQRETMPTFSDFFLQDYLPVAQAKKRSWANDESMFRLRLEPRFGSIKLDKITQRQIEQFHIDVRAEGLAPATADHHLKLLKRTLGLAKRWGILDANAASNVSLFRVDNQEQKYLSDDQLRRLMKVLRVYENRPMACLVMWLISTGARAGEARAANWEDVDEDKRLWAVQPEVSKSKRRRFVPLNSTAIEVLDELKSRGRTTGHLFVGKRGPYRHLTKNWTRICEAANLDGVTLHSLRHNFAGTLVSSGMSLYSVQCILGHASSQTTQRYAFLNQESLQKAADSAAERIKAVLE